jgi:hypothetical protein
MDTLSAASYVFAGKEPGLRGRCIIGLHTYAFSHRLVHLLRKDFLVETQIRRLT